MENYIQELSKICKLSFDEVTKNFKIIQLGSYGVYICNYLRLLDYSSEEIVIRGKIFSTGLGLKNAETK